ncbi:MAG: DNA-directed RNA polymerase subunit delta [Bacilli bacterium]|nr:DNA-directed RNA polymerase subunit delta [Bacilli bacterium]MDD4795121.1 DNA-directed RNA polymerase subunit delta [Bacilli bacterium]
MKVKLTDEEIETMSYDDVAYLILKEYGKKMKTLDLFKKVVKVMKLDEEEITRGIGDFFELLLTDKRFIMLENGFWDLKTNHLTNIIIDEDDDDEEFDFRIDDEEEDDSEINYDEDADNDDDDDDLENLVIIDDSDTDEKS